MHLLGESRHGQRLWEQLREAEWQRDEREWEIKREREWDKSSKFSLLNILALSLTSADAGGSVAASGASYSEGKDILLKIRLGCPSRVANKWKSYWEGRRFRGWTSSGSIFSVHQQLLPAEAHLNGSPAPYEIPLMLEPVILMRAAGKETHADRSREKRDPQYKAGRIRSWRAWGRRGGAAYSPVIREPIFSCSSIIFIYIYKLMWCRMRMLTYLGH